MTAAKNYMRIDWHRWLDYDDGTLIWSERFEGDGRGWRCFNSRYAGKPAGGYRGTGYLRLIFDAELWSNARIVWVMHHNENPEMIDHVNHIRDDNRIENLRSVTRGQNARNRCIGKNNKTGVMGVTEISNGYNAQIRCRGVLHPLGVYPDLQSAAAARYDAERRLGFHPNHGTTNPMPWEGSK